MVWHSEQSYRCSQCGTFDWEWEDPTTGEFHHPWVAELRTCNGCFRLDDVVNKVQSSKQSLKGVSAKLYRNVNGR